MLSTSSDTSTHHVRVETESFYVPDRSDPSAGQYFFGYRIRITNRGEVPVRLLRRHWIIMDGYGHVEHVRGEGVVGEQPRLDPGESFEYQSACPLSTVYGTMEGAYVMRRDDGSTFEVSIGKFSLFVPSILN